MTNDTKIQTSCYSKDKYTVYDSYCQPDRYYKINCFDQIYKDIVDKLLILLIYSAITIVLQVSKDFVLANSIAFILR